MKKVSLWCEKETAPSFSEPLMFFQVITDTHVTVDPSHVHNQHFERALLDIQQLAAASGSAGIMHAGDITDHGDEAEYAQFSAIVERVKQQGELPPMLYTIGNHDTWKDWEQGQELGSFKHFTGMTAVYYDRWIGGSHFIFLGSELQTAKNAELSSTQLAWLAEKLEEHRGDSRPVFLFLHQPLKNTVAGSLEEQEWYGVNQDEELRAVLASWPQVILFTGHTHWELGAPHTVFDGQGEIATMFNAASVAYLWTDEDAHKAGSQGYYIEVYEQGVRVRGRDFVARQWMEAQDYFVHNGHAGEKGS
ncbi:metallophosphoesterase family protein [Paenibacillus sp. Leaf72]|uniref:metallophosphoesterase family protein n=1 Tax=Paenibacillus sp. Leaf72 TaxID=1736234 RepID=UPI0006F84700|nr:metallophosphoesterase [Paenibacillus sp. Leaf72]KQO14169.1 hypothetical protein ASF12_29675 [Paenibacillus sp. Leaf72]